MLTLVIFVLCMLFVLGIVALGAAWFAPASTVGVRLQSLVAWPQQKKPKLEVQDRIDQVLDPLSKIMPQSPADLSETRQLLVSAGYRETRHVTTFNGLRILTVIGVAALTFVTGLLFTKLIAALALIALAYILPQFILKRMITARQLRLRLALPDALDLAVICVEAGLALDQAINRIAIELKHVHPDLSDEFTLMNLEMRAGKPRAEALRNLALRTGVDDIRALSAVLIQTDRFGTSVASALRVHSDALRTERRQRAEEAAAKTTIKMVPILVFFVFPAMFVVTLGPAVVQVIRNMGPALK